MKKTAIVTGADRGLGFGLAGNLLSRGYAVIAGQYNKNWSLLGEINDENLHIIPLDVSDQASVDNMRNFAMNNFEGIDLLINNAGILNKEYDKTIQEQLNTDALKTLYDVNAVGPLRVCRAIIPYMIGIKRLCFISSEAGSISKSYRNSWYAYCMSKAALNMAATIMYNDLSPKGYSFRVIHPGHIKSYMNGEKSREGKYEPSEAAAIVLNTCLDLDVDEDRLYMIDDDQREYPW